MKLFASLIVAAATLTAAPAMAHEGQCMWDSLAPTKGSQQQSILAIKTEELFAKAIPLFLKENEETMYGACNIPKDGRVAAHWAFVGYASSQWTALRLKDRWDAKTLADAFDNVPPADIRLVAGRLTSTVLQGEEATRADVAVALLYKPFGRTGQQNPLDDLDNYFVSRAMQYGGETELHEMSAKASAKP